MISKEIASALNEQIVHELHASNSYLAIASFMDGRGLKILAGFFFRQSAEEREHAMKILRYLLDVDGDVRIGSIPEPKADFQSVEEAVQTSLDQEIEVTGQIHRIMGMADDARDYPTASFLKWFVDEQVEEQSSMNDLLALVQMAGPNNLLLVEDRLLKQGAAPAEG